MNNSNSINTPLHVVNFVASQSNFAYTVNLLFWGSINYTCCRFIFTELHAGDEHLRQVPLIVYTRVIQRKFIYSWEALELWVLDSG